MGSNAPNLHPNFILRFVKKVVDVPQGERSLKQYGSSKSMAYRIMARKDERLQIPALGEYLDDLLTIGSWLNRKNKVQHGQTLLVAKLQEEEARIKEQVEYLAKKRGISAEELWFDILTGKAAQLAPSDIEVTYKPGDEG